MYENPEIFEVGPAVCLTLGTSGGHADKCECVQPSDPEELPSELPGA